MGAKKAESKDGQFCARDAATELRTTVANVKNLVRTGVLPSTKEPATGRLYFSAADVVATRRYMDASQRPGRGERTARAFEAFRRGDPLADVVIALRITYEELEVLRREYEPGAWFLTCPQVLELRAELERSGIRCASPALLLAAVQRLCARDRELSAIELATSE